MLIVINVNLFVSTLLLLTLAASGEKKETETGDVIGIDLGTTYSCVGVFRNGRVEIIANDQGNRITPSYVAFTEDDERLIGDAAKNQLTGNPKNTIFDVKRLIGRTFDDRSVQRDLKVLPFQVVEENKKPMIRVKVKNEIRTFTPEEVSGMVLSKMKQTAESYLGRKVTHAVVTVPAYFNDAQRKATKDAGTIAGLNVMRIINEPTAAAIAYGMDKKMVEQNILVFDLGGGTFDVSLLSIDSGVFEVVATNGDTHLGGEDFDHRIMDYFMKLYKRKTGVDVRGSNSAVQKLRREVEKAKRMLSSKHIARIEVENFFEGKDFSESLSRAKFEEINNDLFRSTLNPVSRVLEDADLTIKDIDEIVLVGGSTRIPKIQKLVQDFFHGKEPNRGLNPDEAIAFGAAVQGGVLSGEVSTGNILLLDVCPLTLGIETMGGVMAKLIPRNTVIPAKKSQIFSTAADNQEMVTIAVHEGERPMTKNNHLLGKFDLAGIESAPRGMPQIEVTFKIDANGILEVTAEDKKSGNSEYIVIKNDDNRLSQDQIEKMVNEAESFAEEDKKVKLRTEAISSFESVLYGAQNAILDPNKLGNALSKEAKDEVKTEIKKNESWLNENRNLKADEYKKREAEFENFFKRFIDQAKTSKKEADKKERKSKKSNKETKAEL